MTEVKWIKITTNMFDDEKIKLIRKLPEADSILLTWIQLLTQAGKANASGSIVLSEKIPYTDEMLAVIFDRPINIIRLALATFQQFGMIDLEDGVISISNWEKHQNVDGLEKIREQDRLRKQRQREKQKLLSSGLSRDSHGTVTESHATDIDIEEEKENNIPFSTSPTPYKEIVDYLNEKVGSRYKSTSNKTKDLITARANDGFALDDFKRVIDVKTAEWLNTENAKYLRPETLFGTKFEGYLNQPIPKQQAKKVVPDIDPFLLKMQRINEEAKAREVM